MSLWNWFNDMAKRMLFMVGQLSFYLSYDPFKIETYQSESSSSTCSSNLHIQLSSWLNYNDLIFDIFVKFPWMSLTIHTIASWGLLWVQDPVYNLCRQCTWWNIMFCLIVLQWISSRVGKMNSLFHSTIFSYNCWILQQISIRKRFILNTVLLGFCSAV